PGLTKTVYKSEAEIWLQHKDRRECPGGPIFDPTGKISSYYWNLWKSFAVRPVKNRQGWSLLRDHLYRVIAAGNDRSADYIFKLAADMMQRPDKQGEVSAIFQGEEEGVGKGLFMKALLMMLGVHGLHLHHQDQIRSRFNDHLH